MVLEITQTKRSNISLLALYLKHSVPGAICYAGHRYVQTWEWEPKNIAILRDSPQQTISVCWCRSYSQQY